MTAESSGWDEEGIRVWLDELRGLDLTDAEVEAAAQRLVEGGESALPLILEQYGQEDETLLAVATQALMAWRKPYPVERLIERLRDPGVDALAKGLILMVLEGYGLDIQDLHVLGVGIDLDAFFQEPTGSGDGGQEPR